MLETISHSVVSTKMGRIRRTMKLLSQAKISAISREVSYRYMAGVLKTEIESMGIPLYFMTQLWIKMSYNNGLVGRKENYCS
jgi:hypothetical protein